VAPPPCRGLIVLAVRRLPRGLALPSCNWRAIIVFKGHREKKKLKNTDIKERLQLGSNRPLPEQGILVVWAFFFFDLAMIIS
jgi:hypothetical protein